MSDAVSSSVRVRMAGPPSMLTGVHHVGLTVTDVDASEIWYGRVIGLQRVFVERHYGGDGTGYAVVIGAERLAFNIGLDHHPGNAGEAFDATRTGLDHVCFRVADRAALESWASHLTREEVEHSGVVVVEGMPFAVINFRDPDGIALELISPA